MKLFGVLVTTAGFVLASLGCVIDGDVIRWGLFAIGMIVGVVGVALLRLGDKQERAGQLSEKGVSDLVTALSNIVKQAETFSSKKDTMYVYDYPQYIDDTFLDDIDTFVNGRKKIAYAFGVQSFADVMTEFAAGERYLNRVWSSAVDGYENEANTYIGKAQTQFTNALKKLQSLG